MDASLSKLEWMRAEGIIPKDFPEELLKKCYPIFDLGLTFVRVYPEFPIRFVFSEAEKVIQKSFDVRKLGEFKHFN